MVARLLGYWVTGLLSATTEQPSNLTTQQPHDLIVSRGNDETSNPRFAPNRRRMRIRAESARDCAGHHEDWQLQRRYRPVAGRSDSRGHAARRAAQQGCRNLDRIPNARRTVSHRRLLPRLWKLGSRIRAADFILDEQRLRVHSSV